MHDDDGGGGGGSGGGVSTEIFSGRGRGRNGGGAPHPPAGWWVTDGCYRPSFGPRTAGGCRRPGGWGSGAYGMNGQGCRGRLSVHRCTGVRQHNTSPSFCGTHSLKPRPHYAQNGSEWPRTQICPNVFGCVFNLRPHTLFNGFRRRAFVCVRSYVFFVFFIIIQSQRPNRPCLTLSFRGLSIAVFNTFYLNIIHYLLFNFSNFYNNVTSDEDVLLHASANFIVVLFTFNGKKYKKNTTTFMSMFIPLDTFVLVA